MCPHLLLEGSREIAGAQEARGKRTKRATDKASRAARAARRCCEGVCEAPRMGLGWVAPAQSSARFIVPKPRTVCKRVRLANCSASPSLREQKARLGRQLRRVGYLVIETPLIETRVERSVLRSRRTRGERSGQQVSAHRSDPVARRNAGALLLRHPRAVHSLQRCRVPQKNCARRRDTRFLRPGTSSGAQPDRTVSSLSSRRRAHGRSC